MFQNCLKMPTPKNKNVHSLCADLRCKNMQKNKIVASSPITSWQIERETVETVADFIFGAPKSLQMVIAAMKLKDAYSLEGKL